jgi:hypothetical protein
VALNGWLRLDLPSHSHRSYVCSSSQSPKPPPTNTQQDTQPNQPNPTLTQPLQILDDGRVTDSQGRTVSFKNAVIILTSNLGSGALLEAELQGGHEGAREAVMAAVRAHFRPEFVNRIDEFVVFDPLRMDQIKGIVKLQVRCSFFWGGTGGERVVLQRVEEQVFV